MLKDKTIIFIGAGSMAEAMIAGMVAQQKLIPQQITAVNRSNTDRRKNLAEQYGIRTAALEDAKIAEADVIVLAVKPKDAESVLEAIKADVHSKQLILSVLAGISSAYIAEILTAEQPVIRVMPNTSSTIGESATAIAKGQHAAAEHMALAEALLDSIGSVNRIEEEQMDVFTGIAGSGPAYIYYLVEQMEKAGQENGLDARLAREIAVQTIFGASRMLMETDESPEALRKKVTSPNGTTAAGLTALQENGGGAAIKAAIESAAARSRELSEEFEKLPVRS
ncbi:pyrroline-5-carboxylate reductase [Aneurinibacillus sp. REN35]|uniref:pyrroline-5-carboxylate reductase n=1 Tax=Aneurinibacillus sp. REN35 TaxID=3237286 RepID=UPI00352935D4